MSKSGKKSQPLTDDMISVNADLDENSEQNMAESQLRKRHKQPKKTVDRTLLISQTQQSNTTVETCRDSLDNGGRGATKGDNSEQSDGALKLSEDGDGWNKNQQTILEWALRQYPKGTEQRWEKIAEHIPGKSKVRLGFVCGVKM